MARIAIVTGGTRGIGEAICLALKQQGYLVVANYAGNDDAAMAFKEKNDIPVYKFDVGNFEACQAAIENIEKEIGSIEILVNNAGITRDDLLVRMKDEKWDEVIGTNLKAIFRLSREVLRSMMMARSGRIINIASIVGSTGNAGQSNYAAAKAGILGLSKSLAREVGSRNITINCVAPGFVDTDMTRALSKKQQQDLLQHVPLKRLGKPEDIASAVAFLASPSAGYITGATLHVNGGMYME